MKKSFTILLILAGFVASAQPTHVVISQIYGGGSGSGATYSADYIEIFNPTASTINISNYTLHYQTSAGNTWIIIFSVPSVTYLSAGSYFLIQTNTAGSTGAALPTPDGIGTTNINATVGKIMLTNTGSSLGVSCPSTTAVVDVVAYGNPTTFCGEGSTTGTPSNTSAATRAISGCKDANDNSTDFSIVAANPHNSASTPVNCVTLLPLSLKDFSAIAVAQTISLQWNTNDEQGVKDFAIERTVDFANYGELGKVAATNQARNTYQFSDISPFAGVNYYRLKTIDRDGKVKYSGIVKANIDKAAALSIFPNPAQSTVSVSHAAALAGATIRIATLDGKTVLLQAVSSGYLQTQLTVGNLAKGQYLVEYSNNGKKSIAKLIKE